MESHLDVVEDAMRAVEEPTRPTSTSPSARSTASRIYAGTTYDRLREIRERFDPTELFRSNHRIQPAGSAW